MEGDSFVRGDSTAGFFSVEFAGVDSVSLIPSGQKDRILVEKTHPGGDCAVDDKENHGHDKKQKQNALLIAVQFFDPCHKDPSFGLCFYFTGSPEKNKGSEPQNRGFILPVEKE